MLVVQNHCRQGYESTMMALETIWSLVARIVMVKEPFIIKQEICHFAIKFYWPQGVTKNIRVMTEVKKDFADEIRSKSQNGLYQPSVFYAIRNPRTASTIYKAWKKNASC